VAPNDGVPTIAFIALGSNIGDRAGHLALARDAIRAIPGCRVLAESAIEETAPLGGLAQDPYLNQMVAVECSLDPRALLAKLHDIEHHAGRVRTERWAPRTLDLDLVRFDDLTSTDPTLMLPHPGLANREFWQRELAQLEEQL